MVVQSPFVVGSISSRAVNTAVTYNTFPVIADAKSRVAPAPAIPAVMDVKSRATSAVQTMAMSAKLELKRRSAMSSIERKHLPGVHDQESHATLAHRYGTNGPIVADTASRARRSADRVKTPSTNLVDIGSVARRAGQNDAKPNVDKDEYAPNITGEPKWVRALGRRRTVRQDLPAGRLVFNPHASPMNITANAGNTVGTIPIRPVGQAPNNDPTPIPLYQRPKVNMNPRGDIPVPGTVAVSAVRATRRSGITATMKPKTAPKLPSVFPTPEKRRAKRSTSKGKRAASAVRKRSAAKFPATGGTGDAGRGPGWTPPDYKPSTSSSTSAGYPYN